MNQADVGHQSNRSRSRLIRVLIVVALLALTIGGFWFVLSQSMFQLILINETDDIMTVHYVKTAVVQNESPHAGDASDHVSLLSDQVIQPHSTFTLPLPGRRYGRVLGSFEIVKNRETTFKAGTKWGYRCRFGYDTTNKDVFDCEASTLRKLYDSVSRRLPLPASWRE